MQTWLSICDIRNVHHGSLLRTLSWEMNIERQSWVYLSYCALLKIIGVIGKRIGALSRVGLPFIAMIVQKDM